MIVDFNKLNESSKCLKLHKMTQPKLVSLNEMLYIQFTLDGKRVRKSLYMSDTKRNRHIVINEIIPKLILRVNCLNE
jgi:hypothetical protein